MSDMRDVIFQRDPFQVLQQRNDLEPHEVHFFEEAITFTHLQQIQQAAHDSRDLTWMVSCWGQDFVAQYALQRPPRNLVLITVQTQEHACDMFRGYLGDRERGGGIPVSAARGMEELPQ